MTKKSAAAVVYEFTVYQEAANEINDCLKNGENNVSVQGYKPHFNAVNMLNEGGMGHVEKLHKENVDDTTTYRIKSPGAHINTQERTFNVLDMIGLATGEAASGFPYQSIIVKEFFGQEADFGVVKRYSYLNGELLHDLADNKIFGMPQELKV